MAVLMCLRCYSGYTHCPPCRRYTMRKIDSARCSRWTPNGGVGVGSAADVHTVLSDAALCDRFVWRALHQLERLKETEQSIVGLDRRYARAILGVRHALCTFALSSC